MKNKVRILKYVKNIEVGELSSDELAFLESILFRLGYNKDDYRIVEHGCSKEMKIKNRDLHRDMRTIRKTFYTKKESNV